MFEKIRKVLSASTNPQKIISNYDLLDPRNFTQGDHPTSRPRCGKKNRRNEMSNTELNENNELRRRIAELEHDAVGRDMVYNDHIKRLYRMSEVLRMFADCEYPLTDFPRIARETLAEIGAMQ